jgi:hypothetical protein
MEGFCLDIQRLILKEICGPHHRVYHLRHLFRVNHMFRRWVGRYVVDTVDKQEFLRRACNAMGIYNPLWYTLWNVFDTLLKQWNKKFSMLLSSFVMYLDAIQSPTSIHITISRKGVDTLFFNKKSILTDMKKKKKQKVVLEVQEHEITKQKKFVEKHNSLLVYHEAKLAKNTEKRDAALEAIEELESKYKKQKK